MSTFGNRKSRNLSTEHSSQDQAISTIHGSNNKRIYCHPKRKRLFIMSSSDLAPLEPECRFHGARSYPIELVARHSNCHSIHTKRMGSSIRPSYRYRHLAMREVVFHSFHVHSSIPALSLLSDESSFEINTKGIRPFPYLLANAVLYTGSLYCSAQVLEAIIAVTHWLYLHPDDKLYLSSFNHSVRERRGVVGCYVYLYCMAT